MNPSGVRYPEIQGELKPVKRNDPTVKRQPMLSEGLLRDRTNSKINLSVRFFFNSQIFLVLMSTYWMLFREWPFFQIAVELVFSLVTTRAT